MTDNQLPDDAITAQLFVVEDCLLCCAECGECLTENRIEHAAACRWFAAIAAQAAAAEREAIIADALKVGARFPADHPKGAMASYADWLRVTRGTPAATTPPEPREPLPSCGACFHWLYQHTPVCHVPGCPCEAAVPDPPAAAIGEQA